VNLANDAQSLTERGVEARKRAWEADRRLVADMERDGLL
jgi:hypothetical protein